MNKAEIEDIKRNMDFNATAAEIITNLVETASIEGFKFQKENKNIFKKAEKIIKEIENIEQIIYTEDDLKHFDFSNCCAIGIDGSHFPIGGVGGRWYIPFAIVRILYENGIHNQPIVDVYAAGIDEIREQEDRNVNIVASRKMLIRETAALDNWADQKKTSIVFIDGPIIDPPSYIGRDYVLDRCNAIKKALKNSLLIGCVKKSRDTFFIRDYEKRININLNAFPSDQHLFAYLFSLYRSQNKYEGMLSSKPLKPVDKVFNHYKKNGVHIYSFFFQKSMDAKILRLDTPLMEDNLDNYENICEKAAVAASNWQYPHQYIPVPVELAHQKCSIKEGTAQVLYDEIITRATSGSVEEQIVINTLR